MNFRASPLHLSLLILGVLTLMVVQPSLVEAGGSGWWVNTTDDSDDGLCDTNHCSLREAIIASNATSGQQIIAFDIPGPGPHEIALCSALPPFTDPVLLDGTLEPDYSVYAPSVAIMPGAAGPECNPPAYGLWFDSSNNVVRGLSVIGFNQPAANLSGGIIINSGTDNLIERNFIGFHPDRTIVANRNGIVLGSQGHTLLRNSISGNTYGIHIFAGNQVIQHNFIGSDPEGEAPSPAFQTIGIYIEQGADYNLIGGVNQDDFNVISGNGDGIYIGSAGNEVYGNRIGTDRNGMLEMGNGTGVFALFAPGTNIIGKHIDGRGNLISGNITGIKGGSYLIVEANFIGTQINGTTALPNQVGISISGTSNKIGGHGTSEGNVISGNTSAGIVVSDTASDNVIVRNKIGTDLNGIHPLGNYRGIFIQGDLTYVGTIFNPSSGNVIAYNQNEGVLIGWSATGNQIENNIIRGNGVGIYGKDETILNNSFKQNNIYENALLGIDLGPQGVTPNDPGDTDTGANTLLNFPELSSASTTMVSGSACPGCMVEVYLSDNDPSGHGEGMTLLGNSVATNNGQFQVSFSSSVSICDRISATATDPTGNTSEFSQQQLVGACFVIDPSKFFLIEITIFILGVLGGRLAGRSPRIPLGAATIVGGISAAVLGAGMIAVASTLPNVELDFTRSTAQEGAEFAALPVCDRFLDPSSLSPSDGETFPPDANPELMWEIRNAPEGELRWQVELLAAEGASSSMTTTSPRLLFSELGVTAEAGDRFLWRVTGEIQPPDGEEWEAFCEPASWRSFGFLTEETLFLPPWDDLAPPAQLPGRLSPPSPIGEDEAMPEEPIATALMNATCRAGPNKLHGDRGYLLEGESSPIEGRNEDWTWWWILNPDAQGHCWVWRELVSVSGDTSALPLIEAPPLPRPTAPPVQGCYVFNDSGGIDCVSPCPRGAEPGSPCTIE